MKVGDLVKVYHFSHGAREKLTQQGMRRPDLKRQGIDGHYVGLVVGATDNDPKYRRVLRSVDGELEVYNVNRLEVIA
jgi:hypothetical protein